MDDDRDSARRREAFREVIRINAHLVAAHPSLLRDSESQLAVARTGAANRQLARRRDWFFGLYPPSRLRGMLGGEVTE